MTNNDDNNRPEINDVAIDQLLDEMLKQDSKQSLPQLDEKAKRDHIIAAKSAFLLETGPLTIENKKNSQGNQSSARPIVNQANREQPNWLIRLTNKTWSILMNSTKPSSFINNNKPIFATLAVAFVASSLVFINPEMSVNNESPIITTSNSDTDGDTQLPNIIEPENVKESTPITPSSLEETITTSDELTSLSNTNQIDTPSLSRKPNSNLAIISNPLVKKSEIESESRSLQISAEKAQRSKEDAGQRSITSIVKQKLSALKKNKSLNESKHRLESYSSPSFAAGDTIVASDSVVHSALPRAQEVILSSPYILKPEPTSNGGRLDDSEEYANDTPNSIKLVSDQPVSTFSIDVDTASYSLIRNQLNSGYLPKPQAVRPEEFINYFNYDYKTPNSQNQPFQPNVSIVNSPWNNDKQLVHIGIKGYDIAKTDQPNSNIVFLLDVSGSMNSSNKLPLVKQSVSLLLDSLKPRDKVSIVVYAGAAGTVLEPTNASNRTTIMNALKNLNAGGSTAGGAGIRLAYSLAEQNYDKNAVNRIILATDGDFNVGQRSNDDLKALVERKRESGVYLSILGFGRNNYQDDMMQTLAQNGNGIAAYIDTLSEAKKVLVDEATSNLFPIANDVKIQIEFNPNVVSDYRLVGYETRHLNREDFNNDKVDAGEIGAGHTVTAIYEITPTNAKNKTVDDLRYANKLPESKNNLKNELGFLKIRYKKPGETKSSLISREISSSMNSKTSNEVHFSIAVAGFAQLLSNSKYVNNISFDDLIDSAQSNKGEDKYGYRAEFINLVRMAKIAQP